MPCSCSSGLQACGFWPAFNLPLFPRASRKMLSARFRPVAETSRRILRLSYRDGLGVYPTWLVRPSLSILDSLKITAKERLMLKVGDKAPAFRLESDEGNEIALKDFAGQRVLL